MQLQDSVFLITGGASGLGEACARRFVQHGGRVVIVDLNRQRGDPLTEELNAGQDQPAPNRAAFVEADITTETGAQSAIDLAVSTWGGLHVLVNCAGILGASRVLSKNGPHSLELFSRVIHVNLIGVFNTLRLAALAMQSGQPNDEGERGVIVNTSSVAAFEGQIGQAAYAASKGGVASMTLPLARELGRLGIRVAAVAPGVFETPMMESVPDEVRRSLESQIPFPPRLGKPQEFAALVQHIVENPMINGAVLRLDGAVRMGAK